MRQRRRAIIRSRIGRVFDVTEFLDHGLTPRAHHFVFVSLGAAIFLDGRRFVCWMDEFWRLLAVDRSFENFAKDGPKTWRKLNAVMCLATQSPSDVLDKGPISRTLVEQNTDQGLISERRCRSCGVHAGPRTHRAGIQID